MYIESVPNRDSPPRRVGRVIERFHMAKHLTLTITDTTLAWARKDEALRAEAALDGLYVIRTSLSKDKLDANAAVAAYKSLAHVERAFRSMKTVDLNVRREDRHGVSGESPPR